jgi:hypothetical protein
LVAFRAHSSPSTKPRTGSVECLVLDGHFKLYAGATSAIGPDGISPPSAANVVRVPRGGLLVACFASAPVTFLQPLSVSFTKIDGQRVTHAPEIPASAMKHAIGPRI